MKRGYFFIAIAVMMFSSMEVALKLIANEIHPIQMTFTRFAIGAIFLAPVAIYTLRKKERKLDGRSVAYLALVGFVGIALAMSLYQMAVIYLESGVVAIILSCNPVFVTFLAYFILKEPIKKRHIAALVLEIIGTVIIINPLNTTLNPTGVVLILLGTFLFSLYGVMGKEKCGQFGGATVTCLGFVFGSLILFAFVLLTHIPAVGALLTQIGLPTFANIPMFAGYTAQNIPVVLYVSVGVSGIGFCSYFLAMEYQPASVVSLVYFFKPALAPILAWMVLGETVSTNMMVGLIFILCGSICAILPAILEAKLQKRDIKISK